MSYNTGSLLTYSDGSLTATVYTLSPTLLFYSPHHVRTSFFDPIALVMAVLDLNGSS